MKFSDYRMHGEWFQPAPEIIKLIKSLPPLCVVHKVLEHTKVAIQTGDFPLPGEVDPLENFKSKLKYHYDAQTGREETFQ